MVVQSYCATLGSHPTCVVLQTSPLPLWDTAFRGSQLVRRLIRAEQRSLEWDGVICMHADAAKASEFTAATAELMMNAAI